MKKKENQIDGFYFWLQRFSINHKNQKKKILFEKNYEKIIFLIIISKNWICTFFTLNILNFSLENFSTKS